MALDKDIPLTANGTDIDFGRDLVSGAEEYCNAALLHITNAMTYDDLAYGLALVDELGKLADNNYAQTLGLRCCAAIQNDERFITATVDGTPVTTNDGATVSISIKFVVEVGNGETFPLVILVANGEVRLVS
jgi:hypothetical protein